jgi:hypothetical protein
LPTSRVEIENTLVIKLMAVGRLRSFEPTGDSACNNLWGLVKECRFVINIVARVSRSHPFAALNTLDGWAA